MLTQIRLSQSINRTVKAIATDSGGSIAIAFTDGTFVHLEPTCDRDGCSDIKEPVYDIMNFNHASALDAGIVTQIDIDKARAAWQAMRDQREELQARQTYEQLKKRFDK